MADIGGSDGKTIATTTQHQYINQRPPDQSQVVHPDRKEFLKKRLSKSRLSKQDEVEEMDLEGTLHQDISPSSENSENMNATRVIPDQHYDMDRLGEVSPLYHTPYGSPEIMATGQPDTVVITQHHNGHSAEDQYGGHLESQTSVDSTKDSPTGNQKSKLQRCHALCDDASPPPDSTDLTDLQADTALPQNSYAGCNTLQVSPTPQRMKLGKLSKDSSVGSDNGSASGLSRDSSFETANYTDSTGIDLELFIEKTLNKNTKDRMMLLKLEQDMINFIKDEKHQFLRFPSMSSYHRMLVHRIAAFFGLDHNVDQSGKSVVVNKTSSTRLPDFRFKEHVQDTLEEGDQPKKILKKDREYHSFEEHGHGKLGDNRKNHSFEERKEKYEEVRKRIFDNSQGGPPTEIPPDDIVPEPPRIALKPGGPPRWTQSESRPWSSTDSSYSSCHSELSSKGVNFTKASSFGGMSLLSRDNSRASTLSSGSKMSKTDSQSSGFSEMRGGQRHPTIPSSPPAEVSEDDSMSSPHDTVNFQSMLSDQGQSTAVWVCSNLDSIPIGSVIINPNTGQPFTNQDGTLLRWPPPKPAQPPNTLQVPSQQPPVAVAGPVQQTSQHEHQYQDSQGDLQQHLSQMTLTSPQIQGQPASAQQQPIMENIAPSPQQLPQSGVVPPTVPPPPVPPPPAAPAHQATPQTPTQLPQQMQYFTPNQAVSGQPVRYMYHPQQMYQANLNTQPISQLHQVPQQQQDVISSPQQQAHGTTQQPTTPVVPGQQQSGVTPTQQTPLTPGSNNTGVEGGNMAAPTAQTQYVYSYPVAPAFQQMTVQSVETYGQQQSSQQQQPPYHSTHPPPVPQVTGGATTPSYPPPPHPPPTAQQHPPSSNEPPGGYSPAIAMSLATTPQQAGALIAPSYSTHHTGGMAVQYYTASPNTTAQQMIAYHHHSSTVPQGAPTAIHGPAGGGGQVYRPKTPPSQSIGAVPPPPQYPVISVATGPPGPVNGVQAHPNLPANNVVGVVTPTQQYVSYSTYPHHQMASSSPSPQQQMLQPAQHRGPTAQPPPQMLSYSTVPTQGPAGFTMVRPLHAMGARSTPPPPPNQPPLGHQGAALQHMQYSAAHQAAGLPILNTNTATNIKVISMTGINTKEMMQQQHAEITAHTGMVVNEKGEPGGSNGYTSGLAGSQPMAGVLAMSQTPPQHLLTTGMQGMRGVVQTIPQIRPAPQSATFRATSPILQQITPGISGEVRLIGPAYPRHPLYNTVRPRSMTPSGGRQTRMRRSWIRSSQDSAESNPSSAGSPDQQQHEQITQQPPPPLASALLEISGLPSHLTCAELPSYLSDLITSGATLYLHSDDPVKHQAPDKSGMNAVDYTVLAGFPSDSEAARALSEPRGPGGGGTYVIMSVSRNYDPRSLCQIA